MEVTASLVERAAHLVGLYLGPTIARLGITQGEAHVLAALDRSGPTPIGALHREFGHKRSTLTNILDRLEERRLVRREVNPADRRSFVVHLSAAGRRAARQVTDAVEALEQELRRAVSADELAALATVTRELERIAGAR